jgi:hypothetical protein
MTNHNSALLVENVGKRLGRELEEFNENLITPQGQIIPLTDKHGNWLRKLTVENVGYIGQNLNWKDRFHEDDYVEWIFRAWTVERLETSLTLKRVLAVAQHLVNLYICDPSPEAVEEAVFEWARDGAIIGANQEGSSLPSATLRMVP